MKIKSCIYIAVVIVWGMSVWRLNAQNQETYNEKVVVVAPYQPSLGQLEKPHFQPKFIDSTIQSEQYRYNIVSRPVSTVYPVENIRPARIAGESIEKLYGQHIRLGFGNYLTPLAEAYFSIGRSESYAFSFNYRFNGSFAKLKDYTTYRTDFTKHEADVIGQIFAEKFTTSLHLNYNQDQVSCYGVNHGRMEQDTLIYQEGMDRLLFFKDPTRWYQNFDVDLQFDDNSKNFDDLKYTARAHYHLNMSNWQSMENTIQASGKVSKALIVDGNADKLEVGGLIDMENNAYKATYNHKVGNAFMFKMAPTLHYSYSIIDLNVALMMSFMKDSLFGFTFNPNVHLNIAAVDKYLNVQLGIGGGVNRQNLERISRVNPFLHPIESIHKMRFEKELFSGYVGLQGYFIPNIEYKLFAKASLFDNYQTFDMYRTHEPYNIHYDIGYNDYTPVYLQNLWNVKVQAELNFRWSERIISHLELTYDHFNQEVLYKPAFQAKADFRYNIGDKFIVTTEFLAYTNMKAKDERGNLTTLKGGFDWSAGLEYRFYKRWSAFVQLNNLIAQRFFKWYDYPGYRFNFLVGATVKF